MKRAWNFLWILLTAAVTAAGFFLPRLALSRQGAPNFAMNYQTVEISSRPSTDYAWRLKTLTRQKQISTVLFRDVFLPFSLSECVRHQKNNVDCPDSTGRESMKSLILSVAAYMLILC